MTAPQSPSHDTINSWADDPNGPVALHLRQELLPVEGKGGVIFPPTYADIGYNIDTLADGTKVATIDSVGSQANRMEPIFKHPPYDALVPQIKIELHREDDDNSPYIERLSLLDLAHRSADAVVHSCPTLVPEIARAFRALKRHGDAGPLCCLAPTSLVFGVWDSRGGSGEKIPRLVRSIIRAWDVQPLHAAAQFNSVWKALNAEQQDELQKEAKAKRVKLSEKGFADAPATFRKVGESAARHIPEFREGSPNLERRVLGGVLASGRIEREVTVNLVALRRIGAINDEESTRIRRYLLALTLIAATTDIELFLREGCHLRFADEEIWQVIPRRGNAVAVDLTTTAAQERLLKYAQDAVQPFQKDWPKELVHKFDLKEAKKLLAKRTEEEQSEAS
ncbi:Type I-U CRISPR-associated protein Cas7 [Candidatus Defluviicoccus seviourii]|uniref:Type I-U CRISPR-associated protein Cas7 n=2 Tax=root TaxID=1 RepID=A0A564WDM3_9PROT|nr:Type I-U CRISPR-associated protein Cas7 [uncultured Defluviicoccus sp.]VUX46607.1 Type I-U CRISPR-associated protein Cas7 [Candidatus Defluviicoccus seviourii]